MRPQQGIFGNCLGINGQHAHLEGCDGTVSSVCTVYSKESNRLKSLKQTVARIEFPVQFLKYVKAHAKSTHVGRFSRGIWLKSDGTLEQIEVIERLAVGGGVPIVDERFGGLKKFQSRGPNGRTGGERPIATNRKSQRKLEKRVLTVIIPKQYPPTEFGVEDRTRKAGLDYRVYQLSDNKTIALVDAKSDFTTTRRQDKEIEQAWKDGIPVYLVGRRYLPITSESIREPNGSKWIA